MVTEGLLIEAAPFLDKKQAVKLSVGSSQAPHSALHPSLGSCLAGVWVRASLVRWSHSLELLSDVGLGRRLQRLGNSSFLSDIVQHVVFAVWLGRSCSAGLPPCLHPSFLHPWHVGKREKQHGCVTGLGVKEGHSSSWERLWSQYFLTWEWLVFF